ncbi:MAG: hypothetical protein J6V72_14845 [Kiritimatiellae bacterium]|nr:hypothetical protein [Kiritimatiellia bacterium]
MDITPYLGPIVTALIAFGATYAAFSARLTKLETMIEDLRRDVEKHNSVVERTFKLETEVGNLYHRYDELRTDVKDVKIGGSE